MKIAFHVYVLKIADVHEGHLRKSIEKYGYVGCVGMSSHEYCTSINTVGGLCNSAWATEPFT